MEAIYEGGLNFSHPTHEPIRIGRTEVSFYFSRRDNERRWKVTTLFSNEEPFEITDERY